MTGPAPRPDRAAAASGLTLLATLPSASGPPAGPLLGALRARREAVAAEHAALQRRLVADRVALGTARETSAEIRDTAAALRAEAHVMLDDVRARRAGVGRAGVGRPIR